MKKLTILWVLLLIGLASIQAQQWMNEPYLKQDSTTQTNFYKIQSAFHAYEKSVQKSFFQELIDLLGPDEISENQNKFPGYAQYKRWEWYMEQRVYPSGDIRLPSKFKQQYIQEHPERFLTLNKSANGTWTAIGPNGSLFKGDYGGSARINFIRFDPSNVNTIYVGAPTGGLWKSTNGGLNWSTQTDWLSLIGCSDLLVHPQNSQILYLATGDANGVGSQLALSSIGVLKSTNGGLTWGNNTMNWQAAWGRGIYKLLMHPTSPDTIFAATSVGIYKTTNGGNTWILVQSGQFTDIEFKPFNPQVVYASNGVNVNGSFYRSTNGGSSFTIITLGLPAATTLARCEIAVSQADSNYVYFLAVKPGTYDFEGLYRSTDGGSSFTLRANTPNILAGIPSSQAWYNLAMVASPINKDTLLIGAFTLYRSGNGGLTFTKIASHNGIGTPFVHADQHHIVYPYNSDTVFMVANDGGLWKSINGGNSYTSLHEGLGIAQMYKLGVCRVNPHHIMTGHQDMGTFRVKNGVWELFTGNTGDGMEVMYEYDNDSIMYLGSYNGRVIVTTNNYPLFNVVCTTTGTGVNASASWITPMVMHPQYDSVILIGKAQLYRSVNRGVSFTQLGTISGGASYLNGIAYALTNPSMIYVSKTNRVFASYNGGSTFIDKTGTLPISLASITSIMVSEANPAKIWVSFSGYNATTKVYASADSGSTWVNVSNGLPNLPVNCLAYQKNTSNGIYAGTDVGVYFLSDSLTTWLLYSSGLPNVDVEEMEITLSLNKIRAATNGRGLWESDLAIPVILDSLNYLQICAGNNTTLSAQVLGAVSNWKWSLPGSSPATSNSPNPTVNYALPGTYTIQLTVSVANGSCSKEFTIQVIPSPPTPSISQLGAVLQASSGSNFQWYRNGVLLPGANSSSYTLSQIGTYQVKVTNAQGCSSMSAPFPVSALPVNWLSLKVENKGNYQMVYWSTAQEINNAKFVIERRFENGNFIEVGMVNAFGNSGKVKSYGFADSIQLHTHTYYRIKQIDLDGKFSYSKTVSLLFTIDESIKVWPIPASHEIHIEISSGQLKPEIQLINAEGKAIKIEGTSHKGYLTIPLKLIPSGIYQIQFFNSLEGIWYSRRIIIQP